VATTINLGVDIRIPAAYIPEEHQRLRMYKVIGGVKSKEELAGVVQELEDRYGALPSSVRNLVEYAELKLLAGSISAQSIERKKEAVEIGFPPNAEIDPSRLMQFLSKNPRAQFSPAGVLRVPIKHNGSTVLPEIQAVLQELQA
jgi:transcription-repair coupling factor (superfamily II helicase)